MENEGFFGQKIAIIDEINSNLHLEHISKGEEEHYVLVEFPPLIPNDCQNDCKIHNHCEKTITGPFKDYKLAHSIYSTKVIDLSQVSQRLSFQIDLYLLPILSQLEIAPKIYDSWICRNGNQLQGVILMEKFDGNLVDLIKNPVSYVQKVNIIDQLITKVRLLAYQGIHHMELKPENILYKFTKSTGNYTIYIADYDVIQIVTGELTPTIQNDLTNKHFAQIAPYIGLL